MYNIKLKYFIQQLQHLLNDSLLDQIPPLINLKQSLYQLSLSEVSATSKRPLIMEINAEVRCYNNL